MKVSAGLAALMLLLVSASGCTKTEPRTEWTPLFNGDDLSEWQHVGEGGFELEDGVLRTQGGMGLLWYTPRMIENEVIRVVYMAPESTNAGVFIRIPERPTEPWMPVDRGYEVQIDHRGDDYHVTGTLYSLTRAQARPERVGEWNTMDITLDGERTIVEINGVVVTDYREGDPVPEKGEDWEPERGRRPLAGYIGLQNHGGDDVVLFREVSVRPLNR